MISSSSEEVGPTAGEFVGAVVVLIEEERKRTETHQAVIEHPRSDWDEHVATSVREKTFRRQYRMDVMTFPKLVNPFCGQVWRGIPASHVRLLLSVLPVCVWYT